MKFCKITVGSKNVNVSYLSLLRNMDKNCTKCIPQIVLFSTIAFRSMFICTMPTVVTFVLRIVLYLRWRYTETPTQLIKKFDIPTSVGYRLYRVTQLLLWQTNNYSSIQRFILTAKDSSGVGVTVKATIFHAVQ